MLPSENRSPATSFELPESVTRYSQFPRYSSLTILSGAHPIMTDCPASNEQDSSVLELKKRELMVLSSMRPSQYALKSFFPMNLHRISNVDLRGTWLPETYPHRRFSVDEESISPVSRSRTTDNASKSVVVLILLPYAFPHLQEGCAVQV